MPEATSSNPGGKSKSLATSSLLDTSPLKRPRYTISEDQTKDHDVRKRRVLAFSKRHCPTSPLKRPIAPTGNSASINPPQVSAGSQIQTGDGQRPEYRPQRSPSPSIDPETAFRELLSKYKNVKRLYFDGKTEIEHLNNRVQELEESLATQMRTAQVEASKHTPDHAGEPKHNSDHVEAAEKTSDPVSESKHNNTEKPSFRGQAEIDQVTRQIEQLQVGILEAVEPEATTGTGHRPTRG